MYHLTLTHGERRAIDWVGRRYDHGDNLRDCLFSVDWDSPEDITFDIPEYVAWEINRIGAASEYRWDCFSEDLATKLTLFCDGVI